jgi:predicted site-specific integrase-resolvase
MIDNEMVSLSLSEAGRQLGVSHHTIKKWCDAGLMRPITLPSGRRRITIKELRRFFSEVLEVSEVVKPRAS